jgi:acetyl esterase/lipase
VSLDPELQELIDAWAATPSPPTPPAHEVPVTQARMAHLSETEYLAGEGPAVATVTDETVAGVPVRVYAPEDARGTIAYLHGGGWVLGNLDSVDAVCRALANEAGARVVSIDYRLAPEHPFPAGLNDALAVTRAVDADVVAGDSAGGNLAAVVARGLKDRVKLQLLIYPVIEAGVNTPSYREFGELYGLTAAAMQRFWDLYLDGADGFDPDASPLRGDLEGLPPAYILTASHDVLRDEGEAYAAALERAGVSVTLNRKPGTIHGFWRWQTKAIARDAVREAGVAVRAVLG